MTLLELLRRPEVTYASLRAAFGGVDDAGRVAERVEIRVKYEGYVARQTEEAARLRALDELSLPATLDYERLAGLSREVKEKLGRVRPRSVGQASRIAGVTPGGGFDFDGSLATSPERSERIRSEMKRIAIA